MRRTSGLLVAFPLIAVAHPSAAQSLEDVAPDLASFVSAMSAYEEWAQALETGNLLSAESAGQAMHSLLAVVEGFDAVRLAHPRSGWAVCAEHMSGLAAERLAAAEGLAASERSVLRGIRDHSYAEADALLVDTAGQPVCVSPARRAVPPPTDPRSIRDELDTWCAQMDYLDEVFGGAGLPGPERRRILGLVLQSLNPSEGATQVLAAVDSHTIAARDLYTVLRAGAEHLGVDDWECAYLARREIPWLNPSEEIAVATAFPSAPLDHTTDHGWARVSVIRGALLLEDRFILRLEDRRAPDSQRLSATSRVLPQLQAAAEDQLRIEARWDAVRQSEREPGFTLIIDRQTPYQTVTQVLASTAAAGAQVWHIPLAVGDEDWTTWVLTGPGPDPETHGVGIDIRPEGIGMSAVGTFAASLETSDVFMPAEGCIAEQPTICADMSDPAGSLSARRLLYNRLIALEARLLEALGDPSSDDAGLAVWITAAPALPWQTVVDVAETVRWRRAAEAYGSDADFAAASVSAIRPWLFEPMLGMPDMSSSAEPGR